MRLHPCSALLLGLLLVACQKPATPPAGAGTGTATPKAAAQSAAGPFAWTESPSFDAIPAGPVKGEAQGKPFVAGSIFFEPGFKDWRLVVHEGKLDTPTSISPRGQHITISLPEEPAAGKKWTRPLKYGDGYFQINQPEDPTKTTSWNASNAWVIEITRWEIKPYDPKGPIFQEAGKASGRIAVCYQGSGAFKNAHAAGVFEHAVVRYMGKPYWLREEKK